MIANNEMVIAQFYEINSKQRAYYHCNLRAIEIQSNLLIRIWVLNVVGFLLAFYFSFRDCMFGHNFFC